MRPDIKQFCNEYLQKYEPVKKEKGEFELLSSQNASTNRKTSAKSVTTNKSAVFQNTSREYH
jgi:hypothetical protein